MQVLTFRDVAHSRVEFEDLFARHLSRVRGLARRRFPSLDADEIAQEVMLRVLLTLDRLDARRDPWPYLATITANVGRDLLRATRPTAELDESVAERYTTVAAEETFLRGEVDDQVQTVLRELPPAGRQVLALHAYDDMSIPQIAAFLGCNDNAARQKLFRARRQFRTAFAKATAATAALVGSLGSLRRPRPSSVAPAMVQAAGVAAATAAIVVVGISLSPDPSQATQPIAPQVQFVPVVDDVRTWAERPLPVPAPNVEPDLAQQPPPPAVPAQASITPPQNLFGEGDTHEVLLSVTTPVGTVYVENVGANSPTDGPVCWSGLGSAAGIDCD